jgi:hypothetical protein
MDHDYLYLKCSICQERVKLAKNKGAYWKTGYDPSWLADFLLLHADCKGIVLEFTDD